MKIKGKHLNRMYNYIWDCLIGNVYLYFMNQEYYRRFTEVYFPGHQDIKIMRRLVI
jgi:hypothetical protein